LLTRETFTGPWAGLPVAWTDDDAFDEPTYRADVARCCDAGIPGVYTGGTTGEFYAMEWDEFRAVAAATIEECHARRTPAMIGCTATSTRGAARRATWAADHHADAVQVALPFWMAVDDAQIVPFFKAVSDAAGGMALSIYETTRAKKVLTLDQHRAVKEAVPNYLMVKANAGTVGATPDGCRTLNEWVNVFVGEHLWGDLCPCGANGGCSSMVYWNPRVILATWQHALAGHWDALTQACQSIQRLHVFLGAEYGPRGFTDTAYDRMGGLAGGFLKTSLRNQAPYPHPTPDDVELLRHWYRDHFPDMLDLGGPDRQTSQASVSRQAPGQADAPTRARS